MNKCKDCKYWKPVFPPSMGDCKKTNIATLYNNNCKFFETKKLDIPTQLEDLFNGFKSNR